MSATSGASAHLGGDLAQHAARLAAAARGGRVASGPFLDPPEADALVAALRAEGVRAGAWGGYDGAKRRVVSAWPEQVPDARPKLRAVYVAGLADADELARLARRAGVPAGAIGDAVRHEEGVSLIVEAPVPAALLAPTVVHGVPVTPMEVPVERVAAGSARDASAVVPSLRVDVLGAKAFRVSRSYFAKGVAAGRVRVNGRPATKASSAEPGDEVYAEGLGRFRVERVEGETRRGNLRVTLHVERA